MLIRSLFIFRVPRSDRNLMSTRSKPLPVQMAGVDGGLASALFQTMFLVQYLPSTTRTRKSKHVLRSGMSTATTLILGGRASDEVRDRQVFLHLPTHVNRHHPPSLYNV